MKICKYTSLLLLILCVEIYSADSNETNKEIPTHKSSLDLTMDEMDTIIGCTLLVQEAVNRDQKQIEDLASKINTSEVDPNLPYQKVETDIFEQCVNRIKISDINVFFKNLTYLENFKWEDKYNDIVKIDYSKYNNITDLYLSASQIALMTKFQKVEELFRQKRADNRQEIPTYDDQKLTIGKFDINNIPGYVKGIVFIVIFGAFFGGLLLLLQTLNKKPKEKKDKKKKKTQ